MRLNIHILILSSILTTIVCSCSKKVQDNSVSITLEKEVLSHAISLKTDSAWYPVDSIYAKKFYVYADTILIVETQKTAGNFLDFYNMRNHS